MTRWNHSPPVPLEEFELATPEENLAFARGIVQRLHPMPSLEDAGEGECDDCGGHWPLVRLGRFELCRRCAHARHRAAERAA